MYIESPRAKRPRDSAKRDLRATPIASRLLQGSFKVALRLLCVNVGFANLPRDYAEPSESRGKGAHNYWMLLSIWRELVYK
jgi:hypothetical protein